MHFFPCGSLKEPWVEDFYISREKFSNKQRKDPKETLVITNFCELGVETLNCNYSIPRVLEKFKDYYSIVFGWSGRRYFYKHLVDEFWELDKRHYWLKDYSNACIHNSKNLSKLEGKLTSYGYFVFKGASLGNFLVSKNCKECLTPTLESNKCVKCGGDSFWFPFLNNIDREKVIPIPLPSIDPKLKSSIPENSVAVFARNRKTYGRNLPRDFYTNLNKLLKSKGFSPIYLGENISSLNMDDCLDFSNRPEANDLNFTLSVLSCVNFSIQFWTASTRLSSIVKTPFLLVESPDQIAGAGQEGYRIAATTNWNKKKILISHYLDFLENQETSLDAVSESIDEMLNDNWSHNMSLAKNKRLLYSMIKKKGLSQW